MKQLWHFSGEGNGTPLQYSCLENPMDGGARKAAVHGIARVGHDWATSLSLFTFMHWRRTWQPTPVFLPGESQEQGSLVGCRQTWLKRLSSISSSMTLQISTTTCVQNPTSMVVLMGIISCVLHLRIWFPLTLSLLLLLLLLSRFSRVQLRATP